MGRGAISHGVTPSRCFHARSRAGAPRPRERPLGVPAGDCAALAGGPTRWLPGAGALGAALGVRCPIDPRVHQAARGLRRCRRRSAEAPGRDGAPALRAGPALLAAVEQFDARYSDERPKSAETPPNARTEFRRLRPRAQAAADHGRDQQPPEVVSGGGAAAISGEPPDPRDQKITSYCLGIQPKQARATSQAQNPRRWIGTSRGKCSASCANVASGAGLGCSTPKSWPWSRRA